MLTDYFRSPRTLNRLRSGPLGSYIEGFAEELKAAGYSRITVRAHLGVSSHLCHWAGTKGLTIADLDDSVGARFVRHLPHCRCRPCQGKYIASAAASERLLRSYLCGTGIITPVLPNNPETTEIALIDAFRTWMKQNRGVTERTLDNYSPIIASLLKSTGSNPSNLDFRSVRAFIPRYAELHGRTNVLGVTTALRSFLRYLIAVGRCVVNLDAAVPAVAVWRFSTLPRYLTASEVERIIAACQPSTSTGLRDRAIVLLLARLGLRGDDVVRLRLCDIDWQKANIRVSGKGRREVLLPLTQEIGDALLTYLEHGRPAVDSDRVFIRAIAPLRPFCNSGLVTKLVVRAMHRAGVITPFRGAHVLRHSAATQMLRGGISLEDIGAVLRHRSSETTAQYAKVDVGLLNMIAQPWPEVTSC